MSNYEIVARRLDHVANDVASHKNTNTAPHVVQPMSKPPQQRIPEPTSVQKTHRRISSGILPGLIAGLDGFAILTTAAVTYYALVIGRVTDPNLYYFAVCFVSLVSILLLRFGGLYELDAIMRPQSFLDKLVVAFATAFFFLLATAFSLQISTDFSRIWMASFAVGACSLVLIFRLIAARIIGRLLDQRVFTRQLIVIGEGEQASRFIAQLERSQRRFISVMGMFTNAAASPPLDEPYPFPILGKRDDVMPYIASHAVDDVIIALPWSSDEQIVKLVQQLCEKPVNIYLASDLIGTRIQLRSVPEHFVELPMFELIVRPLAGWQGVIKQALDYILGALFALIALPAMLLVAIAIKLDSPGPVFYRQARYGLGNRLFYIWKFRTMVNQATEVDKTEQATANDARVTRVGWYLRRMSIDEVPQLFNVLNGTMSLIGPRPHAIDHNIEFAAQQRGYFARHRVKPGITGWAQVNGYRGEIEKTMI